MKHTEDCMVFSAPESLSPVENIKLRQAQASHQSSIDSENYDQLLSVSLSVPRVKLCGMGASRSVARIGDKVCTCRCNGVCVTLENNFNGLLLISLGRGLFHQDPARRQTTQKKVTHRL